MKHKTTLPSQASGKDILLLQILQKIKVFGWQSNEWKRTEKCIMFSSGISGYSSSVASTILHSSSVQTTTQQPGREKTCHEKWSVWHHKLISDSEVITTKVPNPQGCSTTTLTFLWWQMVTENWQTKWYELTQNPGQFCSPWWFGLLCSTVNTVSPGTGTLTTKPAKCYVFIVWVWTTS